MKASCGVLGRIELRCAQRYRISAPVEFEWRNGTHSAHRDEGSVLNISTNGIYVEASGEMPPVGSRIQLEIHLPRYTDAGKGMRLHGEGCVLRVCSIMRSPRSERRGFAASLQFYPEPSEEVWVGL